MVKEPRSYADIVNLWKTAEALADAVGEQGVTVRKWRTRNSIPPAAWRRVIVAAESIGKSLTMEQLQSMAEQKRSAS